MGKSKKTSKLKEATVAASDSTAKGETPTETARVEPAAKAGKKKHAAKDKKTAAKSAGPKPPKTKVADKQAKGPSAASPARASGAKSKTVISADDIALRAYYIAEKRQKLGLPGDSANDWIEAERQLRAEAKSAK